MFETIQATKLDLTLVTEAPWNVNVMSPEKFQDLLRDMKTAGPEATDPIDVCNARNVLDPGAEELQVVTADGAHRVRAAKQLGWKYLYAIHHREITTQEEARLFNYKRDADRGEIDPFKLAESFKWFSENGFNHNVIAERFGVDRTTVSKRLSLLGLDPEVKKHVLARDGLTVSHLEPIATLDPQLQREAAKHLQQAWSYRDSTPSVREVERTVAQIKRQQEDQRKFKAALDTAKYPKCPKCGKPPQMGHLELPKVQCSSFLHQWNLNTGKDPYQERVWSEPDQKMLKRSDASLPQHFKSSRTTEEFAAAGFGFFQNVVPTMIELSSAELSGKLRNGRSFHLHIYGMGGYGTQLSYAEAGKVVYHFYTQKTGKEWVKKSLKTRVTGYGRVTKKEHLKAWEEAANKFLEEYLPRGTKKAAAK